MKLILLTEKAIYSNTLPDKIKGQYWVTHKNDQDNEEKLVSVEGIDGKWIIKSNAKAALHDEKELPIKEIVVEPLRFYGITIKATNEKALIYSEPLTDDRRIFKKMILSADCKLKIGRGAECDIVFTNRYVSGIHSELSYSKQKITIEDINSTNGTFVNGKRVKSADLHPGDLIFIMGLLIIVGKNFIALNNPDMQMSYNKAVLRHYIKQQEEKVDDENNTVEKKEDSNLFYRSPRFKRDVQRAEIKIDPPPSVGDAQGTPLMLMLGPSITMGMASAFTAMFTLTNVMSNHGNVMSVMPTLVMSFSMMIGTVLWPVLTKRYEKKKRIEKEKIRHEKYLAYIESVKQIIDDETDSQAQILNENFIDIDSCVKRIQNRERNLWDRSFAHNDFLKLRLGLGDLPLDADIKYPEKKFTVDNDDLMSELYKLADEPKIIKNVPVTLSLKENNICGIIGQRELVINLLENIIFQISALHSYDELKLIFIFDKKEKEVWKFTKWLPHTWNDERTIRFVATDDNNVKELSAYFEKIISERKQLNENELKDLETHYVIVALNKEIASKFTAVDEILKLKKNIAFSLVALYDELKNLPKECSMVVEISGSISKVYDKNDISGNYIAFSPPALFQYDPEVLAVSLSNICLELSNNSYSLPSMLTFLEMLGVGKVDHINALTRWHENDPTLSLQSPIGVDGSGKMFNLDLHEKFHGPHGLIAGMTGSGKSEFIMAMILSMAVNYHPNEVAFILIDYKGGGMANTFTNLPHVVGTITNLDGAAVKRSLISIQSELKRRQTIFSITSKKIGISNIDIYKYQKLYREGAVTEPLQHLFIISDEFAELKMQQPEFMEQLVSAARIGRSLGVHLILATQKPSGVVDDQIWSNSRFRICLKVQEKADSMDVIKRSDAAELSVTGRFYLQVGFNELFDIGQSAWAGAPYYPSDKVEEKKDESVTVIDRTGRVIKSAKIDRRISKSQKPPKQIDEITEYLARLAKEEGIKVRPLWLEPIPAMIYLDEIHAKYGIEKAQSFNFNPVVGEVDDPLNQCQLVLTLPISKEGNIIVYGAAGSGKTTFITTMLYSLMQNHTPLELNIYILDFASETLKCFARSPYVGDVLLSDEKEKITNLFKMIYKVIEERKKMFSDYGGDYFSYLRLSANEIPSIFVIIHNFAAFLENYVDFEDSIYYLTREGTKYGIFFIMTALTTNAIRYRISQNFKQIFVLQLNDESDYSNILGKTDGLMPSHIKGRGLFKNTRIFEFQTAHISLQCENPFEFIRKYCENYAANWHGTFAKKIPVLPDRVDVSFLYSQLQSLAVSPLLPVGVEKQSLDICSYDFEKTFVNLVLSQNNEIANFVQGLAEMMSKKGLARVIVLDSLQAFVADEQMAYKYIIPNNFDQAILQLFDTLVERNNATKNARSMGNESPEYEKLVCIINSYSSISTFISDDSKDKLKVLLEKGEPAFQVSFIVIETASGISGFTYEPWFKKHVSAYDGIWVGNGFTDQYQLKVTKTTNKLYEEIGNDFGYVIKKGKYSLVKLLTSEKWTEEANSNG